MRKVGNAPERNRHRRKLKEFYRLNKEVWPEHTSFFLLFRQPVANWEQFEAKLTALLSTL